MTTLESGIDVGPTFINLAFFPGPMTLLKALRLLIFGIVSSLHILFSQIMIFFPQKFAHSFCQIFPALRLFFFSKFSRPYIYSFC